MRAPAEVRLDRLEKLIQRVIHESELGAVIVVEGTRDRDSLRRLGIQGTILCLQSSRKNLLGFVEELDAGKRVVVLTDFDREGVSLAKRLVRSLSYQRIPANLVLWRELRGLTRSDVRSIEELPKFQNRLRAMVFFGPTRAVST
jgi:5S rRNA maturation endonuclease (ribonuclease M5)